MSRLAWLRREIAGAYRSLRYDLRRHVDMSRADTDIMFPEYDAYERRPRRMRRAGAVTALGGLLAGAVVLAVTGGLGILLSRPAGGPQPAGTGRTTPAGRPSPSPSPGVVIGSPTPVKSPAPGSRHPRTPAITRTAPPTAPATSAGPASTTATPTPTTTPTPSATPTPTPTPSGSGSPLPSPSTSTAVAAQRDHGAMASTLPPTAA